MEEQCCHNQKSYKQNNRHVRGAPDNSGTELFVIHEGLKVQVIGTLGDWYNVRLADGNEGWIAKTDLEKI